MKAVAWKIELSKVSSSQVKTFLAAVCQIHVVQVILPFSFTLNLSFSLPQTTGAAGWFLRARVSYLAPAT